MDKFAQEILLERITWLIKLRWVAAAGVAATIIFTVNILKFPLPVFPIYTIALIIAVYNFVFYLTLKTVKEHSLRFLNWIANIQISLDLTALAILIHFSGGIENPFSFYFIFHVIIASILLSRRASFIQATIAMVLFVSLLTTEYFSIVPHYCLAGFITHAQSQSPIYILGISFVFSSTLYIAAYMATSISNKMRDNGVKLRQANELLSEKDRLKSEYVLRVTHDIKEHLASIQTCIEPVNKGITGSLNKAQSDLLRRAQERTEKLLFFVKALLQATRIKLYKDIEMDYFSLRITVDNAIQFVQDKAKNRNIKLDYSIDPKIDIIKGAQIYIEETIANILANAVKYTPAGGKIQLKVIDRDMQVVIEVSDTGIGVPQEEIPRLFEEFYRASNARTMEKFGTGLGLSIAKQVVERHNGKIWVESQEGKGSTFYIELPKQ